MVLPSHWLARFSSVWDADSGADSWDAGSAEHAASADATDFIGGTERRLATDSTCGPGLYSQTPTMDCVLCPENTFKRGVGNSSFLCTDCPSDSVSTADRTNCTCTVSGARFNGTVCRLPRGTWHTAASRCLSPFHAPLPVQSYCRARLCGLWKGPLAYLTHTRWCLMKSRRRTSPSASTLPRSLGTAWPSSQRRASSRSHVPTGARRKQ